MNEKPGTGQKAADVRVASAAVGSDAAKASRARGLARQITPSVGAPTISEYTTRYDIVDTKQGTLYFDELGRQTAPLDPDYVSELQRAYDLAVEENIRNHERALREYELYKEIHLQTIAARKIEEAAARGAFDLAQEQERQRIARSNEEKLRAYAQKVLEVDRENSKIAKINREYQTSWINATAEAELANRTVTLARAADAAAQDTYDKAVAERKRIISLQRIYEDTFAFDNEEARTKAFNQLARERADAENVEIQAKNVRNAARADFDASRQGFGQASSALAGLAEQGFALAGITTPTLRQAANEFLLNDDDLQITDLENNIASFAISQGISTASGNLADFIGQCAYDAIYGAKGHKLETFKNVRKQALSAGKNAIRNVSKIRSASALFTKVLKGFSTIILNSGNSYIRSIAAANTLPGGFTIVDDAVDAAGKPIKGAAAYAARTASTATTTAGRIASGLGLAGNLFGAILGAQQMGCIPPFPVT
jgi:hypothetical protein